MEEEREESVIWSAKERERRGRSDNEPLDLWTLSDIWMSMGCNNLVKEVDENEIKC